MNVEKYFSIVFLTIAILILIPLVGLMIYGYYEFMISPTECLLKKITITFFIFVFLNIFAALYHYLKDF